MLDGSGGNTIGGPGNGNVITANNNNEVELRNSVVNQIDSNLIGTNSTGTTIIASNGVGIVLDDSDNNQVLRNTITGNSGGGIDVVTGAVRNTIYTNRIYDNTGLGIDLANNGVTPNDPGDSDTGDNELQNYPVLTSATVTRINGVLDSLPGAIDLHFYSNATCDPSGYGEGKTYIGLHEFNLPGVPTPFSFPVAPGALQIGQYVTATATNSDGNTSEFSACAQVTCSSPDVDDDGDVDVNDIIAVAVQWNAQTYSATYDLNCD
ncbi:MAG: right-handed parallel beta-helix repeat-containing protein, partial [Anaerolineae bacterium]|nr:right-handed parallel beta-helix repeat-containing protein [Anaerolineae bacterium]